MIQLCRKDKKKVYDTIRSGKIDATELALPNLIDDIILTHPYPKKQIKIADQYFEFEYEAYPFNSSYSRYPHASSLFEKTLSVVTFSKDITRHCQVHAFQYIDCAYHIRLICV